MTRDDILRIAQEAQLVRFEGGENEAYQLGQASPDDHSRAYWSIATPEKLELFAALLEGRLKFDGIHTCHNECQRPVCVAIRKAVEREREACATIAEFNQANHLEHLTAEQIRARGEK